MAGKLPPWCKRAKIAKIQQDMSVSDISDALGYSRQHVTAVLNGKVISPPARKRISDFLNISDSDEEE